jgi:hypothetical protein
MGNMLKLGRRKTMEISAFPKKNYSIQSETQSSRYETGPCDDIEGATKRHMGRVNLQRPTKDRLLTPRICTGG